MDEREPVTTTEKRRRRRPAARDQPVDRTANGHGAVPSTAGPASSDERASEPARRGGGIRRLTAGYAFYPLLVLFLMNAVDGLDRGAFNVLLPNIRDDFRLSGSGILAVIALTAPFGSLVGLLVGYLGDRIRRTPMVRGGTLVWGAAALLCGVSPSVTWFAIGRAGAGMGQIVNAPLHQSLIADYYPPATRPKVFAFYRASDAFAGLVGPVLAGLLAASFGWRMPFVVMAVLAGGAIAFSLRLREPVRGRFDRIAAGATGRLADTEAKPPTFGESWRLLYTVATVRRLYFTLPLLGASVLGIFSVMSLYFERVFGLTELQRGWVFTLDQPFTLLGLAVGAPLAARMAERDPGEALRFLRYAAIGTAFFIVMTAVAPNIYVAVGASMMRAAAGAILTPTIAAVLTLVMPPRARSLGFAGFGVWFLPSLVLLPVIGWVGDEYGFRVALLVLAPVYVLGMFTLSTASKSVKSDIENTRRWAVLESQARLERLEFSEAVARGDADVSRFTMLDVRDIHFSYGHVKVLFGVDLQVPRGARIALLGTNGAGKSTLLNVVAGLLTPDVGTGGSVWFKNDDVTLLLPEDRVKHGMVLLGGGRSTFPSLTVEENLRVGAYPFLRDKPLVDERMTEALELFPVLTSRLSQRAGTLSGGEQQLMALARMFIAGPELLMIDELSLGLAPVVMQEIFRMVDEIAQRGTTLILVEQSLNVALALTDHAYFMEKGEIKFSGPTSDLLDRGDLVRSVFFGKRAE
jgi:branched-chain amino acid transport system ATP-binding protein